MPGNWKIKENHKYQPQQHIVWQITQRKTDIDVMFKKGRSRYMKYLSRISGKWASKWRNKTKLPNDSSNRRKLAWISITNKMLPTIGKFLHGVLSIIMPRKNVFYVTTFGFPSLCNVLRG